MQNSNSPMTEQNPTTEIVLSTNDTLNIVLSKKRTVALESLLTKEEFIRLIQSAKDAKDRIIAALGVVGLRANEIGHCNRTWVDLVNRLINIPPSIAKRQHQRIVPFGNIRLVSDIITAYFTVENAVGISRIAVYGRVKKMAARAGLNRPITVHGIRATGVMWFAQAGYTTPGLMEHFGWKSIKTAQHYLTASSASALNDMQTKGANIF